MTVHIHPKSRPITKGWSQIGPPSPRRRVLPQRDLSAAFRTTLVKQENRRIRKLRYKIAQGNLTTTEAIIGVFDATLMVRPPKVFVRDNPRIIEKKAVAA